MSSVVQTWLFVALAGAAGTLLRYALGGWLARATGSFPWETLIINVIGCLSIGFIAGLLDRGALLPPILRMALMVGFLGGFTTFSSFALEALRLAQDAQQGGALVYIFLTNASSLAGVWIGHASASLVWGG
ncbi:MAG TPA: fluoride efflux transporter CrcB [bacterium]|nr:fluoride efflux transporter CrcB [bacterium]